MADGSPDDSITERLQRLQDLLEDDQAQENEADFSAAALDPSISSSSAAAAPGAPGTRGVHISRTGSMEITRDGMPAGLVEGGAIGGTVRVRPSHVQIHRTGSLEIDLAPGSYSPEQQQQQPRFARTAPSALDSVLSAMPSASPAPTATTLTMLPGDEGGVASSTIDDRLKKLEQSLRDDVDDDPAGALGAADASMIMPFSPAASQNTSTSLVVPARVPGGSTPRTARGGGGGRGGQGGRGEEKGVAGGEGEDGEEGMAGSPKFGVSRLLQPGAKLVETRDSLRLTKRKQPAPQLASPWGRGRGDGDGAVEAVEAVAAVDAIIDSDSAAGALRLNQLTDTSMGGRQEGQPDLSAILPARVRQPVLGRRAGSTALLELRWTARVRNPVDGEVIVTGFQAVYRRSVSPTAVGDEVPNDRNSPALAELRQQAEDEGWVDVNGGGLLPPNDVRDAGRDGATRGGGLEEEEAMVYIMGRERRGIDAGYEEYLYNIQCSEIFTLRNEMLHTET